MAWTQPLPANDQYSLFSNFKYISKGAEAGLLTKKTMPVSYSPEMYIVLEANFRNPLFVLRGMDTEFLPFELYR